MDCACLLLRELVHTPFEAGENEIFDVLYRDGYAFREIRVSPNGGKEGVTSDLRALRETAKLLVVLCRERQLAAAFEGIASAFPTASDKGGYCGATLFEDSDGVILLAASDCEATGKEYVKNVALPFLRKKFSSRTEKIVLRCMGVNAAYTEKLLSDVRRIGGGKLVVRNFRRYDEDVIEIICDENTPKLLADDALRILADGLGESVYAVEDVPLEEQLVRLLSIRGKKISVAESFTGGGLARRITSVVGASKVYFEGLNTYDENSKRKRLGVSEFTLKTKGAVSEQTAYEMARGLLQTGDCEIAVATTGLAGPQSDRSGLPVGLCFIAVGTAEKISVYRYQFGGSRKEITEKGIDYALYQAYRCLKNI